VGEDFQSVGQAFPGEIARCRRLLRQYAAIGAAGEFGRLAIAQTIARAETAWQSGDVVEIVQAYQSMKGCD
jgi:hypothetical protein